MDTRTELDGSDRKWSRFPFLTIRALATLWFFYPDMLKNSETTETRKQGVAQSKAQGAQASSKKLPLGWARA
jgi:hypothetical protein